MYSLPNCRLACRWGGYMLPTPLPPSRAYTWELYVPSLVREGEIVI